jgi:uncharacterized cofD-like protein
MDKKIENKKIVTIGGGTGTFALHVGLKKYVNNISAIVAMTDSGGSTGILRNELGVLPPGDVRKCLVALSRDSGVMRNLFTYRYKNGQLAGQSFGNLFISTLEKITGSFGEAVLEASKMLSITGRVIPVTLDKAHLYAELENGQIITGETNIDIPKHDGNLKIVNLFIKPSASISPVAKEAIRAADLIVIGPGDLYTSIGANLVVDGVAEAIKKAKAKKIYVCNLMTKFGETNNFQASDFLVVLEGFLGKGTIDEVICHNQTFKQNILDRYKKRNAEQVRIDDHKIEEMGYRLIKARVAQVKRVARHHPDRLAKTILALLG